MLYNEYQRPYINALRPLIGHMLSIDPLHLHKISVDPTQRTRVSCLCSKMWKLHIFQNPFTLVRLVGTHFKEQRQLALGQTYERHVLLYCRGST